MAFLSAGASWIEFITAAHLMALTAKHQPSLTTGTIFLWKHQISITNRSSSSLLVSLDSTWVCFLIPSKLLFLRVFKEAAGISVGSPGLEGTASSFRAMNPVPWHFPLSGPTRGQGTSPSLHPHCPPEGKHDLCFPSSWCELAEPGPKAGISRGIFPVDPGITEPEILCPDEGFPGKRFGDMPSTIVFLSGELCVRVPSSPWLWSCGSTLWIPRVVWPALAPREGQTAAAEVARSWPREVPLDTKEEGSWASEKTHGVGSVEMCCWEGSRWVSNDPMSRPLLQAGSLSLAPRESDGRDKPDPTSVIREQPVPCSPTDEISCNKVQRKINGGGEKVNWYQKTCDQRYGPHWEQGLEVLILYWVWTSIQCSPQFPLIINRCINSWRIPCWHTVSYWDCYVFLSGLKKTQSLSYPNSSEHPILDHYLMCATQCVCMLSPVWLFVTPWL